MFGRNPAVSAINTSRLSSEEFLTLRRSANLDYASGNVVLDDGWIVSKTEFDASKNNVD
jgi:hypothetical protein